MGGLLCSPEEKLEREEPEDVYELVNLGNYQSCCLCRARLRAVNVIVEARVGDADGYVWNYYLRITYQKRGAKSGEWETKDVADGKFKDYEQAEKDFKRMKKWIMKWYYSVGTRDAIETVDLNNETSWYVNWRLFLAANVRWSKDRVALEITYQIDGALPGTVEDELIVERTGFEPEKKQKIIDEYTAMKKKIMDARAEFVTRIPPPLFMIRPALKVDDLD